MNEIWKAVGGYEGFYEVSSSGNFRRAAAGKGAVANRPITTKRMNAKGYIVIELCRGDHKRRFLAHQLVCRAFLGDPPDGCFVNHKDGVKTNNSISNLEWATPAENNAHAHRLGLTKPCPGAANGRAKLTDEDVVAIKRLHGHMTQRVIAKAYGVARSLIQRIHQGKAWSHIVPTEWPEDLRVQEMPDVQ